MDLPESIESINKFLVDQFGIDTSTSKPIWRVVFAFDQMEKRLGTWEDRTPNGLFIREVTEVRIVPKYRQWVPHDAYVLERLVAVPTSGMDELLENKVSYEPIWTFVDKHDSALPPRTDACKFIIDTVYAAQYGTQNIKKYVDPDETTEKSMENQKKRVDGIIDELFGEQSSLQGTTKTGESIIVPTSFEKSN